MKRSFLNKYLSVVLAVATLLSFSCKKVYDVQPQNAVDKSQMYRDVYDADAAIIGIYGKLMNVAKQYVVLNELRGDLMDITFNSDQYLRQLSEQNVTSDNPYINPQPFYDVILNCNDVMKNFRIMLSQNKLKTDEFRQRYSDVGAIRTWLYLQLAIHYGKVPYVTQSLEKVSDLHDQSKFPMLDFDPMIDSLVAFTESLPSLDNYPAGSTLITVVDGYQTQKFFINKNYLLGDLYLWDGQYRKAATQFRLVMETGSSLAVGEAYYNQYRVSSFSESGVSYSRANDASSLVYTPGWRYLFERGQDNPFNYEWTWVLPFDAKFAPQNPFIDLFSPSGGRYLVKPSQQAIDNWNSQVQTVLASPIAGMPFDARANFTYKLIGGQPVIMKYLYNYYGLGSTPINVLNKQGNWFINRATTAHLHFAEAANRDGQYKIAYALVNRGIRDAYDSLQPTPMTTDSIGKNFRSYVQNRNVTSQENTLNLPPPYDFDARQGDAPAYRSTWYRNQGVRGRANLFAKKLPTTDSLTNIENMIIDENGLELAYEGQRWPDLLRIAMRRNDPSFLADKVYSKLLKSGMSAGAASAARAKLLNRNWFLPFKWQ